MGTSAVDERGRVLIPRDIREDLGFAPGRPVIFERVKGGVLIRPALPMKEALDRLRGIIKKHPRGKRIDPLRIKDIWTEHLPR